MNHRLQTQVKAAPTLPFAPIQSGFLQRKCACGQHTNADGECAECRKKRLGLQRRAVNNSGPEIAPSIVHEVLRSPGRPLDEVTRGFMESRFNHDFSSVRVHTDERAAESARAVNALAYTVGQHVAFSPGQYAPGTSAGRGLLAHELAHVTQQAVSSIPHDLAVGPASDRYEQEAEAAFQSISAPRLGPSAYRSINARLDSQPAGGNGHPITARVQRVVDESEFIVQGVFIHINPGPAEDDQVRQLLRTLGLLPVSHLTHIPPITVGNRPPRGGGSAHSGMPGGPYIRLNHTSFDSSWNSGAYNETLLHEVGHIVDWAYGCMTHMRAENSTGYRALLNDPHTGRTQGPGEHFADAYADYYLARPMSEERRSALLTSRAFQ